MDADAVGCGRRDDPTRCGRCETCREPCPVLAEDGRPCGETKTLDIVKEFRTLYERKMREVESAGGGDNVQVSAGTVRMRALFGEKARAPDYLV